MKITRLALHAFSSAFPGLVELPLDTLDPGVYAVVGGNGAGKTTLLEAVPGSLYRQLPSRNGEDPVTYATSRASWIALDFTFGGPESYRARVNMDNLKRQTDAVLEVILSDGTRAPINNGQRSTFDAAIAERFPSFDLFINSAFAAQGRGDEFTRRKPSQRKDLFVEFLALRKLLTMSDAAKQAAELWDDARLRLEAQRDALARDTNPTILADVERLAGELATAIEAGEQERVTLRSQISDLEARAATAPDQVAAYKAAQQAVDRAAADLTAKRAEFTKYQTARSSADASAQKEIDGLVRRLKETVADIDERIAANEKILANKDAIEKAVAALAALDIELSRVRVEQNTQQADVDRLTKAFADAERAVQAFAAPQLELKRAKTDADLLAHVPCGGAGDFAACQFLVNATEAQARITALEAQVSGIAAAIDHASTLKAQKEAAQGRVGSCRDRVISLERTRTSHETTAAYRPRLIEAEARLEELRTRRAEAVAKSSADVEAANERHHQRVREFDTQDHTLTDAIAKLNVAHHDALRALEGAAAGNSQATQLQTDLVLARRAWDDVTERLATARQNLEELGRRRERFAQAKAREDAIDGRLDRVRAELLEWRDLAKAFGKGGLPDLEIDAAGPTISALTNQLLTASFGPRFSVELVTQTAKADGGMKDDFTVRVFDNAELGGWRDISQLSGGQKVIVQEALMAAIAVYVNERSPRPLRTLFRDETGAALDVDTAPRYVAMLRKVRELGGFHAIYFVTHNLTCAALADAQIQVGDGTAQIVRPPFSEAA